MNPPVEITPAKRKPNKTASLMMLAGVALFVFAIGGILLTTLPAVTLSVAGPARVGAPLAGFTLNGLDGKPVKLSDYAGRPVLVNAWATWCPPCRAEMPLLEDYYQRYRAEGLVILAVNVGESPVLARSFVQQNGLTFPILLDSDERWAGTLAIHDFPTSILIGRDGKVKSVHIGMFTSEGLAREMIPLLEK